MAVITMKNLLESGVHFGHLTRRWDPRMKKFIFAQRNGLHIIDLQKTIVAIKESYDLVRQTVLAGKSVLFVGTKKQAKASIKQEAERCDMFYMNNRWLGGMLTNFRTVKKSLLRLKKLEKMEIDGSFDQLTKKEVARLLKEKGRLEKNLGGIKNMNELPGVMFVIDARNEAIAVAEARRMKIPIIGVVDTNCNPEGIDYPIPGNDDAIRSINLFTQMIANAVIEADNEQGLKIIANLQDDNENPAKDEQNMPGDTGAESIVHAETDDTNIQHESPSEEETGEEPKDDTTPAEVEALGAKQDDNTVSVSPKDVKQLRDKTSAGMLDCKKALIEANGNFDEAEIILKGQGLASAEKRVDRATNNGAVFTFIENGKAAMVELTCETDFVAKNDVFRSAGEKIALTLASSGSSDRSADTETMVKDAIAILKENMTLGRIIYWDYAENELVVHYSHNDGIIGVMIKLACENSETVHKDDVKALAFDLALHAAAFGPTYLHTDSVDAEYIKSQEKIFMAQAENLGDKPEEVVRGIVQGKLNKHLAQICFVEQNFVKENKKTIKQIIAEVSKKVGENLTLIDYAYMAIGQRD